MQGLFKCKALGKSPEASKKGKFHYLFVNGERDKSGLFTSFTSVDIWTDVDVPIELFKEYKLVLDINGDFVKFVKFEQ